MNIQASRVMGRLNFAATNYYNLLHRREDFTVSIFVESFTIQVPLKFQRTIGDKA
jgi:hypothetical protein